MRKQNLLEARKKEYSSRAKQLQDPTASADWKRFERTLAVSARRGGRVAGLRRCFGRAFEATAEREVQVDALHEPLGLHAQQRDARSVERELLLWTPRRSPEPTR